MRNTGSTCSRRPFHGTPRSARRASTENPPFCTTYTAAAPPRTSSSPGRYSRGTPAAPLHFSRPWSSSAVRRRGMDPWTALLVLFLQSPPGRTTGAPAVPPPVQTQTGWDDYAWPTEAGRIVTSTFGEYRSSHFHAGIDISSGDTQGYGVFASRSGYVSRIRISPTGYGKMLYIRHPDGFTTTYAHLEKFSPALDAR